MAFYDLYVGGLRWPEEMRGPDPDKRIVVYGTGDHGPERDLDMDLFDGWDGMAVNRAAFVSERTFQHWATVHVECMERWRERCPERNFTTHGHAPGNGIDMVWDIRPCVGTSAMFAVFVALALGYGRILLWGVPLENHDDYKIHPSVYVAWKEFRHILAPYVRSISGWTMGLLGAPALDWIF